jgi:hypothetical protein
LTRSVPSNDRQRNAIEIATPAAISLPVKASLVNRQQFALAPHGKIALGRIDHGPSISWPVDPAGSSPGPLGQEIPFHRRSPILA